MRDECGALALAQVAEGALAGESFVAEHPQQVVDQLEADAEQAADLVEDAEGLAVGVGEQRARVEGELEGVDGGLELGDGQRLAEGARLLGRAQLQAHIGELADRGGMDGGFEEVQEALDHGGGRVAARDRPERGEQAEVPGEDARRISIAAGLGGRGAVLLDVLREAAGQARHAAAHQVAVDHVVLDDESRVQQLQRCGDLHCGFAAETAEGAMRRGQQRRTEPLAVVGGLREG